MAHQNPGLTKNGPVNYRINARRLVLRASERRSKMIAVEVKDRRLTLSDVESTLLKSRQREIRDIFFAANGVRDQEKAAINQRVARAFAAGQNLYVFDLFEIARSVLALGGEPIRAAFLRKVGEHLNRWNTQPRHRQDWKKLLDST